MSINVFEPTNPVVRDQNYYNGTYPFLSEAQIEEYSVICKNCGQSNGNHYGETHCPNKKQVQQDFVNPK